MESVKEDNKLTESNVETSIVEVGFDGIEVDKENDIDEHTFTEESNQQKNIIACNHFFNNTDDTNSINMFSGDITSNITSTSSSSVNNIIFNFKNGEKMRYDSKTVLTACPIIKDMFKNKYTTMHTNAHSSIHSSVHTNTNSSTIVTVNIPDWISQSELLEYFFYFKNSSSHNLSIQARKVLQIADFFDNMSLVEILIKNEIIPYLTTENSLLLLEDSFQKLTSNKNFFEKVKSWYDLFIAAVDKVADNFFYYITAEKTKSKMKHLNKKLLEEIVEKFMARCILNFGGNNIFTSDKFGKVLDFVALNLRNTTYNTQNMFDLLSNEYLRISSEESVSEIDSLQKPSFFVNLNKEMKHFYEEFKIQFNDVLNVIFVVYYKKLDDSLNVSFKIEPREGKNNTPLPVFTFLSVSHFQEESDKKQITVKSVGSTKTLLSIFRVNQFKQNYIKNSKIDKNLSLCVYLRISYSHSSFTNYILHNFDKFYNQKNINKISKSLLGIIFTQHKSIYNSREDGIYVRALANWLNDEVNLNENLKDLLEIINWSKVDINTLSEFVTKYYKIIEFCEMETYFTREMKEKLVKMSVNESDFENSMQVEIAKTMAEKYVNLFFHNAKSSDYTKLLSENIKLSKFSHLCKNENNPLNDLSDRDLFENASLDNSQMVNFFSDDEIETIKSKDEESDENIHKDKRETHSLLKEEEPIECSTQAMHLNRNSSLISLPNNMNTITSTGEMSNIKVVQYFQVKPEYTSAFLNQLNPKMVQVQLISTSTLDAGDNINNNNPSLQPLQSLNTNTITSNNNFKTNKLSNSHSKSKITLKKSDFNPKNLNDSRSDSNNVSSRIKSNKTSSSDVLNQLKKSNFERSNKSKSKSPNLISKSKISINTQPKHNFQTNNNIFTTKTTKTTNTTTKRNVNPGKTFNFYEYSTTANRNKKNYNINTNFNSSSTMAKSSIERTTSKNLKSSIGSIEDSSYKELEIRLHTPSVEKSNKTLSVNKSRFSDYSSNVKQKSKVMIKVNEGGNIGGGVLNNKKQLQKSADNINFATKKSRPTSQIGKKSSNI